MKNKFIPYGKQYITQSDIDAVVEILKSDFLTQGPTIANFEKAFADYIGSKFAIAVSNGTAALHLCALALNVKEGDKVITTPITFVASANCVLYAGGEIIFSDIDSETYLLDIDKVEQLLKAAPEGTYKGIIPVNLAGRAINMEAFRKLADQYGLWIIEDACHAPGGYFIDSKGVEQKCGNGVYADLAVFSFHPVKHITCGEGGMITTNDEDLAHRLRNLRTHGIQQRPEFRQFYHGIWYYEMQELGFNYRITDIQAALGISQLTRAEEGLKKRREIAVRYQQVFRNAQFIRSQSGIVKGHAYHLYIVEFERRNELINYLRSNNIFAQVHYIPIHLMPFYTKLGYKEGTLQNAENYYKYCLSLPIFPTLENTDQELVIEKILNFFGN